MVLSPEAANGIDATDGTHFLVGADDAALAGHAKALLSDSARSASMGAVARKYVLDNQSWDAMLAPLAHLIGCGDHGVRHVA